MSYVPQNRFCVWDTEVISPFSVIWLLKAALLMHRGTHLLASSSCFHMTLLGQSAIWMFTKHTRGCESLRGAATQIGADRYRYEYSLVTPAPTISHNTHKYTIAAPLPSPGMLCSLNFLLSSGPGHPFSSLLFEKENFRILSRAVSLAPPGEDAYGH